VQNKGLHNLHSSRKITEVIKSRMKRVGLVISTDEKRNPYKVLAGKPEGTRQLGRLGVDKRITFQLTTETGGEIL
jgi:hypothetical protein